MHFGYCCHADAGAHSGEFIYGLESFVYKDIKPGGYAWLFIFSYIKNCILIHAYAFNGVHLMMWHPLKKIWKCNSCFALLPSLPFPYLLQPFIHSLNTWCLLVASTMLDAECSWGKTNMIHCPCEAYNLIHR